MNKPVARIEVWERERNSKEHRVARAAREFLRLPLLAADELQVFLLKTGDAAGFTAAKIEDWSSTVFSDPLLQKSALASAAMEAEFSTRPPAFACEVLYLPGVTDNVGRSAVEAIELVSGRKTDIQVFSGALYLLHGDLSRDDAELIGRELLGNPVIQSIRVMSWKEFLQTDRFTSESVPEVKLINDSRVELFDLAQDDAVLERMSASHCWALSLREMHAIRAHFQDSRTQERRRKMDLPEHPTDVEVEVLAQTWSEHCKHKIFAADIEYSESLAKDSPLPRLGSKKVSSVFKTYIRGATERVREERGLDWLISVFTDNAGVVRFDSKVDLCIKVETHNSPSALDPYGGALTGIVGVNRDVLGCGLGARPIANTDVFCFAPPDWPGAGDEKELPSLLKHPRRIFTGVHAGVEDGGNKSGIPTVNGAFAFHRNYAGKPLVFCGTVGAMPAQLKDGTAGTSKNQKPGDRIVMAGGRIGRDVIHGATFSSMELTDGAPATVVQIGDPITQKRLADFLLEARDAQLFSSVTDNGAGGLSSSVGEMAGGTGGATIDVGLAPVKYVGLRPFELFVSESQERMTFSVPPEKLPEFLKLAERRGVEATDLGEFTNSGELQIFCHGKLVGLLSMEFLHDGAPKMELTAHFSDSQEAAAPWSKEDKKTEVDALDVNSRAFLEEALFTMLKRWNIRSKESWVRRYDHEVQAATIAKPFVGTKAEGPGNGGVLWLAPHGGEEKNAVAVACGLAPRYAAIDAYGMAQHALDEAVRNCVAVGADPDQLALVDNFCWPDPLPGQRNPDADYKLAQLVRANQGLYDLAVTYGAPFVSGKDSMKNDFLGRSRYGKDVKISVPPTVLVTAMARVPDAHRTMSSDFKEAGDFVYLLGAPFEGMAGSEILDAYVFPEQHRLRMLPSVQAKQNLALYRRIHQAARKGLLRSCHDCSEGGLLVALAESCLGGNLGVVWDIHEDSKKLQLPIWEFLFGEGAGRFVVSVSQKNNAAFADHFADQAYFSLGRTSQEEVLRILRDGLVLVDGQLSSIRKAWKGGQG